MFQEALSAIQSGNRARARDLLTRLLKTGQDNPEYWIWMSTVVETPKERSFCLNQALKLDPTNASVQRGLAMMGAAPVDESQVLPARYQRRNWQSKLFASEEDVKKAPPWYQFAGMGLALIAVVVVLVLFVTGKIGGRAEPTRVAVRRTNTPTVTLTPTPKNTPTGTLGPTPLYLFLDATYTPTPVYVNTPHPITEAYRSGIRAFNRGEWEAVRRWMIDVTTIEPGAVDAQFYVGESYRMQQNYAEAIKSYNRAIEMNPDFAPPYLGRARATLGKNPKDFAKAEADLEKAIDKDGNYSEAYLELALLYINNDDPEYALSALESAAPLMPDSPQLYYYQGLANLSAKDYEKALEMAQKANELDFTMLPAYRLMAESMQALGDLKGSLKPLSTYTQFETQDAGAWVMMARAQDAMGNTDEAFKSFDRALRIDNKLSEALLRRADIYLERKNGEKALEDYRAALRIQPSSFEASIGVASALMLQDFPGDAYMQLERTTALAESNAQKAELYYWRGLSLDELGELAAAMRTWNSLLELPKEDVPEEWLEYAQERVAEMVKLTPSATITRTLTSTQTRVPTATKKPTLTPRPKNTSTATPTLKPSRTPQPSSTPVPSKTPTPK